MAGTVRDGLKLLKEPNFAKLFTAYFITYTGSAMAPIAITFGVLDLTGSTRTSSFVLASPVVAQIVILMIGGAVADRTSRQKVMVIADFLAALSQGTVAALFLTGTATVPLLIALMLVNGACITPLPRWGSFSRSSRRTSCSLRTRCSARREIQRRCSALHLPAFSWLRLVPDSPSPSTRFRSRSPPCCLQA